MKTTVHGLAVLILLTGCDHTQDLGHNISDEDGGIGTGDGGDGRDGGPMAADGGATDDMMGGCQKSTGLFSIDVPVVKPTFAVTVDEVMDPKFAGGVSLVDSTTGDHIPDTAHLLIPGTYDIYYGGSGLWNSAALIKKGVKITTSDQISLAVSSVTLRGQIKVGDGSPKS